MTDEMGDNGGIETGGSIETGSGTGDAPVSPAGGEAPNLGVADGVADEIAEGVGEQAPAEVVETAPGEPADSPSLSGAEINANFDAARGDQRVGGLVGDSLPFGDLTPEQFNQKWWNGDAKDGQGTWRYPENDGAISGTEAQRTLPEGMVIDRFGAPDGGLYLSPDGTPWDQRALPPSALGSEAEGYDYHRYAVEKPFDVTEALVAPCFEQDGLGVQYKLGKTETGDVMTVSWLLENGYLREVP